MGGRFLAPSAHDLNQRAAMICAQRLRRVCIFSIAWIVDQGCGISKTCPSPPEDLNAYFGFGFG